MISDDIKSFILSLPQSFSPITMLSMSVLFMQKDSLFAKNYSNISRDDHWDYYYEDGMNLIAKIPQIAALIYRHKFHVKFKLKIFKLMLLAYFLLMHIPCISNE